MRALWREIAELITSPDFLAIAVLGLVLGAGARSLERAAPALCECGWLPRAGQMLIEAPLADLLEDLRWKLRLPR